MEKTRDQLINEVAHYRYLRRIVTDDALQKSLDELISLTTEALNQLPPKRE